MVGLQVHGPASQLCHTSTWTWKATGRVKWDDHSASFLAYFGLGDESEFMNDDPSRVMTDSGFGSPNLPWSVNNYFRYFQIGFNK